MKIISAIVASIAALSTATGAVIFQHGGSIHEHFRAIARKLHLTQDQERRFKALHEDASKQMKAIESDKSLDMNGKETAMAKLHVGLMSKAKSILNPEQARRLHEILAHDMPGMMMHAMDKIGLSPSQKTSVHQIVDDAMKSMEKIHSDKSLTTAQKQEQAVELHRSVFHKIHEILTPEQMEKAMALLHSGGHSIPPK